MRPSHRTFMTVPCCAICDHMSSGKFHTNIHKMDHDLKQHYPFRFTNTFLTSTIYLLIFCQKSFLFVRTVKSLNNSRRMGVKKNCFFYHLGRLQRWRARRRGRTGFFFLVFFLFVCKPFTGTNNGFFDQVCWNANSYYFTYCWAVNEKKKHSKKIHFWQWIVGVPFYYFLFFVELSVEKKRKSNVKCWNTNSHIFSYSAAVHEKKRK